MLILKNIILFALPLVAFVSCSDDDDKAVEPDAGEAVEVRHVQQRSVKRGVSYSFQLPETDMFLLGNTISWFYNWSPDCSGAVQTYAKQYGVSFVPMAWNNNYDTARIASTIDVFGDRYLLAFNEPNLTDQANMTPEVAAQYWPELRQYARANGLKLVSPAMNYGTLAGYSNPTTWLDEFFSQEGVSVDDIDAIALHCYMNSASSLKSYIDMFEKYGKPIWLTEFCAWDGGVASAEVQMAYMSEALAYLEECPAVERYAWFIPRYNGYPYMALLEDEQLSDLGKVFVAASTADKSAYALNGQKWAATLWQSSNASEGGVSGQAFSAAPHLSVTTDPEAISEVEVNSFSLGKWLEYGLDAKEDVSSMSLRLSTLVPTTFAITIDGDEGQSTSIEISTKSQWATHVIPLSIGKGTHRVRISVSKGSSSLSWIVFD